MIDPVELPPLTPEEEASDDCLMDVIRGAGPDFLAESGVLESESRTDPPDL